MDINRLVASPCCNPELPLEEALAAYAKLGFRKFEVFTSWVKSAFDFTQDARFYLDAGRRHGIAFTSLHLPVVAEDVEAGLAKAVQAARFSAAIGARIVLFKAKTRELYTRAAGPFLDQTQDLGLTPVLQNHFGTAIKTLADFREVLDGINDPRMKALLEVGHFHSAGVHWRDGYDLLKGRIELVHIKDQLGPQSVPFGAGEIDLPGLFRHMAAADYRGDYVVEMEVKDKDNTLRYLAEALEFIART